MREDALFEFNGEYLVDVGVHVKILYDGIEA